MVQTVWIKDTQISADIGSQRFRTVHQVASDFVRYGVIKTIAVESDAPFHMVGDSFGVATEQIGYDLEK